MHSSNHASLHQRPRNRQPSEGEPKVRSISRLQWRRNQTRTPLDVRLFQLVQCSQASILVLLLLSTLYFCTSSIACKFVQEEIEQGASNDAAWGVASSRRALVSQSVLGRSWGAEILACFAASEIEMGAWHEQHTNSNCENMFSMQPSRVTHDARTPHCAVSQVECCRWLWRVVCCELSSCVICLQLLQLTWLQAALFKRCSCPLPSERSVKSAGREREKERVRVADGTKPT